MIAWPFRCMGCGAALTVDKKEARCAACNHVWECRGGIWRFLAPARAAEFAPFLADYERIRRDEGRGSDDPAYYKALPQAPVNDPLAGQWWIRAKTWRAFAECVLPALGTGLRVVDCGAGCGWLSYQLRTLGHLPISVDIHDDPRDGLGAARHFAPDWPLVQAEFDTLPLADACADLIVYNGSLHYSADYVKTLSEALRVLAPGGHIVVLDSPIYFRPGSGARMVAERTAAFEKRYGEPPAASESIDYLDTSILAGLEQTLPLRFRWRRVWYGWRWHWGHWRARLKGERERATFAILIGAPYPR